jgi:hypothetical protein
MESSCENGNKYSDSTKSGEFLVKLNEYYLLKKDSAPWSELEMAQAICAHIYIHVSLLTAVLHILLHRVIN